MSKPSRLFLLSVLLPCLLVVRGWSATVGSHHSEAELVAAVDSIQPGKPFLAALRLKPEAGWHTYWHNPGDSGLATSIKWELPKGFKVGELRWPYPEKIVLPPLTTYGYGGEVYLLAQITPPKDLKSGKSVDLKAHAEWLVCKDICVPGSADLSLSLPVVASSSAVRPSPEAPAIAKAESEIPVPVHGWKTSASLTGKTISMSVNVPADAQFDPANLYFYPSNTGFVDSSAPQKMSQQGSTLTITMTKSDYADGSPKSLQGVLYSSNGFGEAVAGKAVSLSAPLETSASAAPAAGTAITTPAENTAQAPAKAPNISLIGALLGALLGGLILNFMPCVFPVISLKIYSFVQQSGGDRRKLLGHGLIFSLGVLVSFWILAGLLLALRAGGEQLGWGYQLQSPVFVAAVGIILFVVALSLLGVYEIGGSLISLAGRNQSEGFTGSFMTGVLATVVATPCTAPFMGAALGYALASPAVLSLLVFTFLGIGMALPYLLISMNPNWLKKLPKPGAWMETFKQVMAFPILATLVWLIWVLGIQVGVNGLSVFIGSLVLLALAAWVFGRWNQPHRREGVRWAGRLVALGFLALGLFVAYAGATRFTAAPMAVASSNSSGINWKPFSPEKVKALRDSGKPVFIDFTAAWCLTCQANDLVAFHTPKVVSAFREKGITAFKADWTNRNPEITEALAKYGRSGVPLYLYFAPGNDSNPKILPQLLTPHKVLDAINAN